MSLARVIIAMSLLVLGGCGLITAEPAGQAVENETVQFRQGSYEDIKRVARNFSAEAGYQYQESPGAPDGGSSMVKLQRGQLIILIGNPFNRNEYVVTGYCGVNCHGDPVLSSDFSRLIGHLRNIR